jgi:hypothetical protein
MSLLPNDDDLDLIHTRQYETRVYQVSDDELLVRGAVSDMKPAGLYVVGDPEPMEIHQMQLELRVSLPTLEITQAGVVFETHPHSECPLIARDYAKLVGISVARGFNRKIRDLFGGAKGCTHTNALLQAMAPAVIQSTWSVSIRDGRKKGGAIGLGASEDREKRILANTNTCHIWSETGEHVASLRAGTHSGAPPLPIQERLAKMGKDDSKWE